MLLKRLAKEVSGVCANTLEVISFEEQVLVVSDGKTRYELKGFACLRIAKAQFASWYQKEVHAAEVVWIN